MTLRGATTGTRHTGAHNGHNELEATEQHHCDMESNGNVLLVTIVRIYVDLTIIIIIMLVYPALHVTVQRDGVPHCRDREEDDCDDAHDGRDDTHEDVESLQDFVLVFPRRGDTEHAGETNDRSHPDARRCVPRPVGGREVCDGGDSEDEHPTPSEEGEDGGGIPATFSTGGWWFWV